MTVSVQRLSRSFGEIAAVKGIDLTVLGVFTVVMLTIAIFLSRREA